MWQFLYIFKILLFLKVSSPFCLQVSDEGKKSPSHEPAEYGKSSYSSIPYKHRASSSATCMYHVIKGFASNSIIQVAKSEHGGTSLPGWHILSHDHNTGDNIASKYCKGYTNVLRYRYAEMARLK